MSGDPVPSLIPSVSCSGRCVYTGTAEKITLFTYPCAHPRTQTLLRTCEPPKKKKNLLPAEMLPTLLLLKRCSASERSGRARAWSRLWLGMCQRWGRACPCRGQGELSLSLPLPWGSDPTPLAALCDSTGPFWTGVKRDVGRMEQSSPAVINSRAIVSYTLENTWLVATGSFSPFTLSTSTELL